MFHRSKNPIDRHSTMLHSLWTINYATSMDNFSQHWNPSKYVFSESSSGIAFSYTPYLSKLVNDIFLANISYYNKPNERSSWSASLKYFSLGDIDILQNPLDIPIIENPNEFTLDAAYSLKLNENFALAVSGILKRI